MMLLVDMTNLFYRGYHVSDDKDRRGKKIGGIQNTLMMLSRLIEHFKVRRVVCCWDVGKCYKRLEIYPEYKAGRRSDMSEEEKENIYQQMDKLKEILSLLPVKQVIIEGIEADDIIGFISQKLKTKKVIISNDKDFIQCVNKNTSLYLPLKSEMINYKNVEEIIGFELKHYVLWKSLLGDASDNIAGIKGLGKVKATKFIREKQKIKKIWVDTLKRNIKLMTVGSILDTKDKKEIINQYNKPLVEQVRNSKIQDELRKLELKKILNQYGYWIAEFRRLR